MIGSKNLFQMIDLDFEGKLLLYPKWGKWSLALLNFHLNLLLRFLGYFT